MSPFLVSITQRKSRAGPTAFLAAAVRASTTAETKTSRLIPFSRSQNSNTAKKSAFIMPSFFPLWGIKKPVDPGSPTLRAGRIQQYNFNYLDILTNPREIVKRQILAKKTGESCQTALFLFSRPCHKRISRWTPLLRQIPMAYPGMAAIVCRARAVPAFPSGSIPAGGPCARLVPRIGRRV